MAGRKDGNLFLIVAVHGDILDTWKKNRLRSVVVEHTRLRQLTRETRGSKPAVAHWPSYRLKEYSVRVETKSHTCIPLARWGNLTGPVAQLVRAADSFRRVTFNGNIDCKPEEFGET